MEKKVIYTEYEPEKKYLWLHTKNNNLVLEVFGDQGWESVGDDSEKDLIIAKLLKEVESLKKLEKKPLKVTLPTLKKDCSKEDMIATIEKLKNALVKVGILDI